MTETETDPTGHLVSISERHEWYVYILLCVEHVHPRCIHSVLLWAASTVMSVVLITRLMKNAFCILQWIEQLTRPAFYLKCDMTGLPEARRCICISDPVVYEATTDQSASYKFFQMILVNRWLPILDPTSARS